MSEFTVTLARLGLAEYTSRLVAEGFDSWETLLDIQESDLEALNVKLGHRRKLQRAIADSKQEQDVPSLSIRTSNASSKEASNGKDILDSTDHPSTRPKRRYKRHPKPDPFAPERPVSAYVLFSNDVREKLKSDGQELNFCDMAKVVGEQWQNLPMEEREGYENYAANKKADYNSQLAEYKKTEQYREYQKYLADFKATHRDADASSDNSSVTKRTKLLHESSTSSGNGSATDRTGSLSSHEPSFSSHQSSVASPSAASLHFDANGRSHHTSSSSGSPGDLYGPIKQSPPGLSPAHQINRLDSKPHVLNQAPAPYTPPDSADSYTRRRASSHGSGFAPLSSSILTSRPLIPIKDGPALPPIRSSNDSAMSMRSLPPPIPSLGKPSGLSSDPVPTPRKHDPIDALIAAAESQAPRMDVRR